MGSSLNFFRKSLAEIEKDTSEFPCKNSKLLLNTTVFHFEEWSKIQDSKNQRPSISKVDIVIEIPPTNPTVIIAVEYKELTPTKKGKIPHKLPELSDENLRKLANEYSKKISKKFLDFCKEYKNIWPNIEKVICFVLLRPSHNKYEEYIKTLTTLSFSSLLKELSKEKQIHKFMLRAKAIESYEKFLDFVYEKLQETLSKTECCNSFFGDNCERLESIVSNLIIK